MIVLEVGGGFAGISMMFILQQWNTSMPIYAWIGSIFICFMFLFGIVAGLALIDGPQLGTALSAVYQAIQIPVMSSPILTYEFLSGLRIGVGWFKGRPAFLFGFGARCTFFLFSPSDFWLIGVNALALALFVYLLLQLRPKAKSVALSGDPKGGFNTDKEINPIEIKSIEDIRSVIDYMHDSEFGEDDFGFDSEKRTFHLKSHSPYTREDFYLEFHNVETFDPKNLDKVRKGKATAGVFNTIKIRSKGLKLILLSQDLHIVLRLSEISGKLEIVSCKGNGRSGDQK